jgi:hypothetical protein
LPTVDSWAATSTRTSQTTALRVCQERDITFSQEGASYLVEHHYAETGRLLRGCHPRDLMELVEDIARYRGRVPALDPDLIDLACESYFVDL